MRLRVEVPATMRIDRAARVVRFVSRSTSCAGCIAVESRVEYALRPLAGAAGAAAAGGGPAGMVLEERLELSFPAWLRGTVVPRATEAHRATLESIRRAVGAL